MARLIDADELIAECKRMIQDSWNNGTAPVSWAEAYATFIDDIGTCETVPAYGQWISVKDRLPEEQKEVLIYLPEYDSVEVAALFTIPSMNLREWAQNEDAYMLNEVSHWMPLPEPPKERYKCRYADDNGVCSKCSGNGEIIYCVEGPCPYMFEEMRDDGKSKLD